MNEAINDATIDASNCVSNLPTNDATNDATNEASKLESKSVSKIATNNGSDFSLINQVTLNCICVGTDVGSIIGSANSITVVDDLAHTRVKSDTVKLSPFQDDDDIDLEDVCDNDTPDLDIATIRAIAALCSGLDFSVSENSILTDLILIIINSITSQAITPAEQALGKFTCRKLKNRDTWNEWVTGERKQLNQFYGLQMLGQSIIRPTEENAVILRSHWQYHVKRDGQRRARQYCDGSKRAAPLLRALAKTYSSCVEHSIQRQFLALAAEQNFLLFGGDVKDAFAHSPSPKVPTFMMIDSQYFEGILKDSRSSLIN